MTERERRKRLNPQSFYAVERALSRARQNLEAARKQEEELEMVTLQGEAWGDEVESLEDVVDFLRGYVND